MIIDGSAEQPAHHHTIPSRGKIELENIAKEEKS